MLWEDAELQLVTGSGSACLTGPAGGAGGSSAGKGEGGRGSQAGRPAGQEREGDPEEGHQEGEAETQDHVQGKRLQCQTCLCAAAWCIFTIWCCSSPQNWNYFADNEADSVKMMEEVEKLCDRLELTRYESVLAKGPPSPKGRRRQRAWCFLFSCSTLKKQTGFRFPPWDDPGWA